MNLQANAAKKPGTMEQRVHFLVLIKRAIYYFYSGLVFGVHVMGPNATKAAVVERQRICGACTVTDPEGDQLFRQDQKGRYFCGKPLFQKKLRQPQIDGCGCFLKIKWKKKWTRCPLMKW